MNTLASKFQQLVTPQRLNSCWPQFNAVTYAIYDDNVVVLFNHPKCKKMTILQYQKQMNSMHVQLFYSKISQQRLSMYVYTLNLMKHMQY